MDNISRTNIRHAQKVMYRSLMEHSSQWMRPDRSVDVDVAHAILVDTYIHNPFALLYIDQNIVEIIQDTVSAMADAEVEYHQHMESMADLY